MLFAASSLTSTIITASHVYYVQSWFQSSSRITRTFINKTDPHPAKPTEIPRFSGKKHTLT